MKPASVALACAAAVVALVAAARPAAACSCSPPPPPCEAYSRVGAIFVGKVTSVATQPGAVIAATFAVEELFKGPFIARTIVVHGGGMCGATFEAGKKYFVYAWDDGGVWHAGLCGRTRPLARAQEDLAYARNLPKRKLAELIGTVQIDDEQGRRTPRAGATVVAQGTSHAAKTDADGKFKLAVPPGKYTLDVVDPGTQVLWGRLPTVEITDPAACASEDLVLRYNGRIRGTLVDHTGKPAVNAAVSAVGPMTLRFGALRARTDANGKYEIAGVQAGTYLVAVNHLDDGGPEAASPIPTTYYPGVAAEGAAKPVTVTRSAVVEPIDFKLPKPLVVYTVTGVLKQAGRPLPGVHVKFNTELRPGYHRGQDEKTDADGRFTFKEVAGAKVFLEVCRPDAGPQNDPAACRIVRQTLTKDWNVELEYPAR